MGAPFRTRLHGKDDGLSYPRGLLGFPFVCEWCTVSCSLQRWAHPGIPSDRWLLQLKHMRMIDAGHLWSFDTLMTAWCMVWNLGDFCWRNSLDSRSLLMAPTAPPGGLGLLTMWVMEEYTTQPSRGSIDGQFITFNIARSYHSAVSALSTWSAALSMGSAVFRDREHRLHSPARVGARDGLLVQLTISGISRRLRTETKPSLALFHPHIKWNFFTELLVTTKRPHLPRSIFGWLLLWLNFFMVWLVMWRQKIFSGC